MSGGLRPTTYRIRLVAVDMDGTFLDAAGEYDRDRFAALHAGLRRSGVRFVVASGNQYAALRRHFADHPDVLYIAENGALTGTTARILRTCPFPPADAARAVAITARLPSVSTLVCTAGAAYALRSGGPGRDERLRRYYARIRLVDTFEEVREPVLKLALSCPRDATEAIRTQLSEALPPGCTATSSGHGSIDIVPTGSNKGTALAWLGNRLGIRRDHMVAFGDGGNDLEMLAYAGTGIAMANAPASVRATSDRVTGSNDEAGVLTWLEHHRHLWDAPGSPGPRFAPPPTRQERS
ncbi:Cof-type HAD-IIB family hydrolase [Brachybacterium huguangmaarense]|uniref:Cof-type HAD-IIB family hydrolase n=1 Tax=Brachybacterium huguangmaarense TaxID=1652028 RepID=A0ABY6FXD1_9MICO|nr:Cof-type HAD-IIB family hydrolase [Brachybacterium huguangmaarense]UYG15497.1 Cof-type HAD-IIB family hydrolase [Brachybacterium huguangmaarense]